MISVNYAKFLLAIILFSLTFSGTASFADPSQEELEKWPVLKEAATEQSKGNFKSALKLYRHAYDNNIARTAVVPSIMNCYSKLEQNSDAMNFIISAAKENPFDREIRILLADKYHDIKDDEKALLELEYAEKLSNKDFRPALKRAFIYKNQEKHDVAIKNFTAYIDGTKPPIFEAYLSRAQCHQATGRSDLAEKDAKKAYEAKPFHLETLITYVYILQSLKKFHDAETFARQCTEVDVKSLLCWNLRGDLTFAAKKYPAAIENYLAASRLAPEDFELRAKLADTYLLTNQLVEADAQFARVLKLRPDHVGALQAWVPSLLKRQDFTTSAEVLRVFHSKTPKDLWAAVEYAKLMSFVGSNDIAANTLKATVQATKSDMARMHYAYYLYKAEKYSNAIDQLEDIKDQTMPIDFNAGVVYYKMKKWEKAVKAFDQVKSESPYWVKAQVNAAWCLENLGKVGTAIDRLGAVSVPADMKKNVGNYLAYLNEIKGRTPAASEDKSDAKPEVNFQSYLEWELPNL